MPKKTLYFLAEFEPSANRRFARIDQKLRGAGLEGEQTRGLPPHVSLACMEQDQLQQARALLAEVCGEMRRFSVEFSHIGMFSGGKVLFYALSQSRELLHLYERLNAKSLWAGEPFAAHATVFIGPADQALRAFRLAAADLSPSRRRLFG